MYCNSCYILFLLQLRERLFVRNRKGTNSFINVYESRNTYADIINNYMIKTLWTRLRVQSGTGGGSDVPDSLIVICKDIRMHINISFSCLPEQVKRGIWGSRKCSTKFPLHFLCLARNRFTLHYPPLPSRVWIHRVLSVNPGWNVTN